MKLKCYRDEIKTRLDGEDRYRELLYRRGYLLTDSAPEHLSEYPFYGMWQTLCIGKYFLYVQNKQTVYIRSEGNRSAVIIGHAYNPFDMHYDENELCGDLLAAFDGGLSSFYDKVSEFTGLHIVMLFDGDTIYTNQDACSLTGCFYGKINNRMYLAEHFQLIADLCGLSMDPKVEKLVQTKCYNIGNRHLPGDLTPYPEVRRLGANTYLQYDGSFSVHRFYPTAPHPEFTTKEEKENGIARIGELIHNGIACCSKKWDRCTISLSGGTDSKTTLSCANGLYDKYTFFSFYSKPQELVDANGAHEICDKLGLAHTIYKIPESNDEIENFDFLKILLQHTTGYIKNLADNEIRKYIFLHDLDAYDIELKSWASEVARVFFERKYQIKMPQTLSERVCSIFQTRFIGHPRLLRWADKTYYRFLREIGLEKPLFNYEHTDLIYWEIRMGCWGVSVISSQQMYHRVSMPMNNRKILELFLCFPHEERKSDSVHRRIMDKMNPAVTAAKVEVPNLYFHKYRIWMEKLYYYFRTAFYRPMK